jgi:hypothetical protein
MEIKSKLLNHIITLTSATTIKPMAISNVPVGLICQVDYG